MPMTFNANLFAETAANLVHLERWALKAQFDAGSKEETEFAQAVRRHAKGLGELLRHLPTRATTPVGQS